MNENNDQMFNIISIVFLVLSGLMVLFVIVRLVTGGEPERVFTAADYPTQIPETATFTPTATNTPTTPPTFTPVPTETRTPIPSPTASITAQPSATITPTPGPSETPVASQTPPGTATTDPASVTRTPTESPFFFDLSGPVEYRANPPESGLGCTFQAIGGRVIGLDGLEYSGGLQVHVIGQDNDTDRVREIGTNTLYGTTSGWEVPVASQATAGQFVVRLESLAGTQLSSDARVQFFGDCARVIAFVEFQQNKPLPGG